LERETMTVKGDSPACAEIRRVSTRRKPAPKTVAGQAAAAPVKPLADAAEDGQPRYLQLARELKRAIVDGRYPVGSRLPTELELCGQFGTSRFTAREALRVLSTAGLVSRRQRVGTVVVALPDDARYTHDAASVPDLLQYAQDTQLRFVYIGKLALSRAQARELEAKAGDEWVYAVGLRVTPSVEAPTRPICITRLYLNPLLKGIEGRLRGRKGAVYALIEAEYGIGIERVEQELQGVVLDADDAANLGARAGDPALRVVRRYYDQRGRLLEMAENVHPSDRFSYRMQLRK
jgi:DNA-binding GntR family transcriptional regulator